MEFSKTYTRANEQYSLGNHQLSLSIFNRELAIKSRNYLAHLGKAKSNVKLGKDDIAEKDFENCIQFAPEHLKVPFIEGCHDFLLINNKLDLAHQLVITNIADIGHESRMLYLLNYILDDDGLKVIQFLDNISAYENSDLYNSISRDYEITEYVRDKSETYFIDYIESERTKIKQQFENSTAFIEGLDETYIEVKQKFNPLKTKFNTRFDVLTYGFEMIPIGQGFFKKDLHNTLRIVEERKNKRLIKEYIIEHELKYNDYIKNAANYANLIKTYREFDLTEIDEEDLIELESDISINNAALHGVRFEEVVNLAPKIEFVTAELKKHNLLLNEELHKLYDELLAKRKYLSALKVGKILQPIHPDNRHYSIAKKKVKTLSIISSVFLAVLITSSALIYNHNSWKAEMQQAFDSAKKANRHSHYKNFITNYPESEFIDEIKTLHEERLFEIGTNSSQSNALNLLSKFYPESDYLREVEFEKKANSTFKLTHIGGAVYNKDSTGTKYLVPVGVKVQFDEFINGKSLTYNKFMVVEDVKIKAVHDTTFIKGQVYFCNAENLTVRNEASTRGDEIGQIHSGDPVKYLGEIGERQYDAEFFDQTVTDYFYGIELLDGQRGWVHGSFLSKINMNKRIPFEKYQNIKRN